MMQIQQRNNSNTTETQYIHTNRRRTWWFVDCQQSIASEPSILSSVGDLVMQQELNHG